ncbi:MAG: iron permease [Candidatus Dactylopiibacterium carminicum]|uniref:Iron permease n=1 Tax=Candidatus Dactylopiibacterium carminicum TaxID=857335 RepID=A0A272EWT5_9RHOO|nr:FTR1 family protein [Candidatus Dactylopiibacterium carminicum]KAF7600032.1 iron permease [Candidatus Dactylopiibacterium carminicum]PAS94578.1 MAG: iron permease [Candidatus Dactylopiibacterium carminicum]PAS97618.1 MAG: iron permease [Candidatus Dactylopiibacterium carminicum]PAT00036.1 MAG: iron permease [Candidatus Dactylopiibacterium carminicum]
MMKKILFLLFACILALPAMADPGDYETFIQDIEGRLDKASAAYREGQGDAAKTLVQSAYFEVFENLEGPIRINLSARKSFEMEAAFGEIRRMIVQKQGLDAVDARIAWLKAQLREVQPAIEAGHRLAAQGTHGTYDNEKIDPYWHDYYRLIDDLLADGISLYQSGDFENARASIQKAQFDGFKNSEMEIAIRQNRSAQHTQKLNQEFSALLALAAEPGQITRLGYGITTLLQDIEEQLEALPIPASATVNVMADEGSTGTANWANVATDIDAAIAQALGHYEAGDAKQAIAAVQDSYFDLFEATGMESRVGARDSSAKLALEGHFTRLTSLMKAGRPMAELQAEAQALSAGLAQAATQLGSAGQTGWSLALMSLIIILREGLEALLIVAAIVAYLVKNGHRDKLPLIRQSVVVALVASVVTAAAFYWLFANAGAQRELLEGFTMIIAVFVLFSMSYWLLSKAEAEHWKAYLEGKISASLTRGSMFGLWFASFLAVYREGAETVLFYQALIADSAGTADNLALLGGFLVGCVLLGIAYLVMRLSVVRLPLRPFFLFTGGFMYLMAFVFAGKSMMELIEGKLFQPTLWAWAPEIPLLGVHPYRETLIPQLLLLLAALFALWVLKRQRSPASAPPAPASVSGETSH